MRGSFRKHTWNYHKYTWKVCVICMISSNIYVHIEALENTHAPGVLWTWKLQEIYSLKWRKKVFYCIEQKVQFFFSLHDLIFSCISRDSSIGYATYRSSYFLQLFYNHHQHVNAQDLEQLAYPLHYGSCYSSMSLYIHY
jgi:hypothetical protein